MVGSSSRRLTSGRGSRAFNHEWEVIRIFVAWSAFTWSFVWSGFVACSTRGQLRRSIAYVGIRSTHVRMIPAIPSSQEFRWCACEVRLPTRAQRSRRCLSFSQAPLRACCKLLARSMGGSACNFATFCCVQMCHDFKCRCKTSPKLHAQTPGLWTMKWMSRI